MQQNNPFAIALYEYKLNEFAFFKHVVDRIKILSTWEELIHFNNDDKRKIAILEFPYWKIQRDNFLSVVKMLLGSHVQFIIIRSIELHQDMIPMLKYFDHPRIILFLGGIINQYKFKYATVYTDPYWLYDTSRVYFQQPEQFANRYNESLEKDYFFDILYGTKKPFRQNIHTIINNSKYCDIFLQSNFLEVHSVYGGTVKKNTVWWEDEIKKQGHFDKIEYYGVDMLPSQVIPFKVYDKAYYSIVIETSADNEVSFFTEKIAKPLLAKRLFIVMSGQYYLKNLQTLGFKTFDGIVDESYDKILDTNDRHVAACNAAFALSKQPVQDVMEKCRSILEHNYNRMKEIFVTMRYNMVEMKIQELVKLADQGD